MTEINIINLIQFDKGYILESDQTLNAGTIYYLQIVDNVSTTINKTYTPLVNTTTIIDSWGTPTPLDGNVCFTLSTSIGCPQLTCELIINN